MACVSSNGHTARLEWMLELTVTSTRGHQIPSISFNHPNCIPNLHKHTVSNSVTNINIRITDWSTSIEPRKHQLGQENFRHEYGE